VRLLPDAPAPIRIDRFVEKYFRISPRYEVLPPGILGFTEFGSQGVRAIVIASVLDTEGSVVAERRVRTTLAHEAGHGLLHMHLFALGEKPQSLFQDGHHKPEILCRDVQGGGPQARYDGRWWEYQANRAIGSLLLPKRLLKLAAEPFCTATAGLGLPALTAAQREECVASLSETFNVNPVVARIRLSEAYPNPDGDQLSL